MNHIASKCAGTVCGNVAVVTKGRKRYCHQCAAPLGMTPDAYDRERANTGNSEVNAVIDELRQREYERANADYRGETLDDLAADIS